MKTGSASEALRFFAVSVAGLVLDLAVAWSAARLFGLPLWLAAATGFAVAAAMNYALHELWTFRAGARQLSAGRALRYGAALAATLAGRVAAVALLEPLMVGELGRCVDGVLTVTVDLDGQHADGQLL